MADVTTGVTPNWTTENSSLDASPPGMDPYKKRLLAANQACITIALITIMIGMGCTMTLKEIWKNLRRPSGIVIGVACQFVLMPFLGWTIAQLFQLSPGLALGTLAIATCPGGTLSNIFTFWTDGDTCLSVCMTTCSTIIGIAMMPLNLFIYSRTWAEAAAIIPYVDIIIALVIILFPAALGMLIHWKLNKWADLIAKICSVVAVCFIFIVLILVAVANPKLYLSSWKPYMVAFIYPLCSFGSGYLVPHLFRMPPAQARTVAFETGVQNGALALTIINLLMVRGIGDPEMAVVPTLHTLFVVTEGLFLVGVYKLYVRHRKPKKEAYTAETKTDDKVKVADGGDDEWTWTGERRHNGGIANPALDYGNEMTPVPDGHSSDHVHVIPENRDGADDRGGPPYGDRRNERNNSVPLYASLNMRNWSAGLGNREEPISPPVHDGSPRYVPNQRNHAGDYVPIARSRGNVIRDNDNVHLTDYRPNTSPRYAEPFQQDRSPRRPVYEIQGVNGSPPQVNSRYERQDRRGNRDPRRKSSEQQEPARSSGYRYPEELNPARMDERTGAVPQQRFEDTAFKFPPATEPRPDIYAHEVNRDGRDARGKRFPPYGETRRRDGEYASQPGSAQSQPGEPEGYPSNLRYQEDDREPFTVPRRSRSASHPRRHHRSPAHSGDDGGYAPQRGRGYDDDRYRRVSEQPDGIEDYDRRPPSYWEVQNEPPYANRRERQNEGNRYRDEQSGEQPRGQSFNRLPSLPSNILQNDDTDTFYPRNYDY